MHFDVTVDDIFDGTNRTISNSIPTLPDFSLLDIYQYSFDFIDELCFYSNNNNFNFELKEQTFMSPIKTPLTYRTLGNNDLTVYISTRIGALNTEMFLNNATLD